MKFITTTIMLLLSSVLFAQQLPKPSPGATVKQTIGLTEAEVVYSRPRAHGREIFGGLVPYDEMWRTGANKATMISFNTDVMVQGKKLPAGAYSLFTIPGKKEWTIVINKNTELWGVSGYKESEDVMRFMVESEKLKGEVESFTIGFENVTTSSAELWLTWEKTGVKIDITVDSETAAWANINAELKILEDSWRVYVNAADYAAATGQNLEQALQWTQKALEMNEYWWTYSVQAKVYAAMKDFENAKKSLQKAIDMGSKMEKWPYADTMNTLMEEYKNAK